MGTTLLLLLLFKMYSVGMKLVTGCVRFVFLVRGDIFLVAVSSTGELEAYVKLQLEYIYQQVNDSFRHPLEPGRWVECSSCMSLGLWVADHFRVNFAENPNEVQEQPVL